MVISWVWTDLKRLLGRLKSIWSFLSSFRLKFLPDYSLGATSELRQVSTLWLLVRSGERRDEGWRDADCEAKTGHWSKWVPGRLRDWPSPSSLPSSFNTKLPPWEYIYLQESVIHSHTSVLTINFLLHLQHDFRKYICRDTPVEKEYIFKFNAYIYIHIFLRLRRIRTHSFSVRRNCSIQFYVPRVLWFNIWC